MVFMQTKSQSSTHSVGIREVKIGRRPDRGSEASLTFLRLITNQLKIIEKKKDEA